MATSSTGIAELKVNGAFYGGWKTLRANRSIEQLAGTFNLGVTERWPGQPEVSPIRPGFACQLLLDGDPVVTGYLHVEGSVLNTDDPGIARSKIVRSALMEYE